MTFNCSTCNDKLKYSSVYTLLSGACNRGFLGKKLLGFPLISCQGLTNLFLTKHAIFYEFFQDSGKESKKVYDFFVKNSKIIQDFAENSKIVVQLFLIQWICKLPPCDRTAITNTDLYHQHLMN